MSDRIVISAIALLALLLAVALGHGVAYGEGDPMPGLMLEMFIPMVSK